MPSKLSTAKVVPRLEVLEQAIAALNHREPTEASSPVIGNKRSTLPSETESSSREITDRSTPEPPDGFLVKEGTSTRYINEALFSSVLEKVSEISRQ
jgi:hypothetical protein